MSQHNQESRPNAPPLIQEKQPEMSDRTCRSRGCGKRLTKAEVKLQTGKRGWSEDDGLFCVMHRKQ